MNYQNNMDKIEKIAANGGLIKVSDLVKRRGQHSQSAVPQDGVWVFPEGKWLHDKVAEYESSKEKLALRKKIAREAESFTSYKHEKVKYSSAVMAVLSSPKKRKVVLDNPKVRTWVILTDWMEELAHFHSERERIILEREKSVKNENKRKSEKIKELKKKLYEATHE